MTIAKKTLALLILDGWGHRAPTDDNAITTANTPNLDALWQNNAAGLISGSGLDVGLPDGQMGNSEVGHINIGAGRIVYQELTRIGKAINDGDFDHNQALVKAVDGAIANNGTVHVMGLLSPGGVHSHQDHIKAMIKMAVARGAKEVILHGFLDGRDTPPRSADAYIDELETLFTQLGKGRFGSIIGRYYAMDRDQRWDRVEKAYRLLTEAYSEARYETAYEALAAAYERDENDEFVAPSVIGENAPIVDGDALIFMNFRADRARQLTRTFTDPAFDGFVRQQTPALASMVMLTQYAADIDTTCAFPPNSLVNTLGEVLAKAGRTQLRISETEKYAHVTFFFNGGIEAEFPGEQRILINSPKVATYDLAPAMSSAELTHSLIGAIDGGEYDVIICNYPNGDMVGHTGDFDAAVKACEAVDSCVGEVISALQRNGGECIITADHGNAEQMKDANTGQAHTAHTSEPVPFIYVGREATVRADGVLSDIAPTMLELIGEEIPTEMSGSSLLKLSS
ncbi:2,3-bisphosphoglycerate-independent phosphoglycerate mutase [Ferrimonas lipolytica]|uniref:2,3-bisphosphoglycerate-independent phosphoglycerate mutase n=1 Tax=Ferrimonas lipolytica TaxID=2724191 RepID=A0A6H1UIX8_9GAMM|nr:2,3-bisphosphoglycerate-independent phosphoglycerate mutase [Ferrimonas lipolytica]QIZ78263.1 2,3-bisphosphoglycerate-independent phosphoglycerate mutase [Ferrimonas lipolytica]